MKSTYTYDHFSLSDVGSHRQNNEDSFGGTVLPNGRLFIVCDGMGAHQGGEHASSMCVRLIKEYFINQSTGNSSIDLYNAINFANEQLFITANNNPELKGMGTTVVALIIGNNEIFIGHVGDSRIYLLSSGELIQLTKDHSYVQSLVDQGIISRSEMETHSRKNELTKAVGIFSQVQPSISKSSIQVKAGDKFLLCTDGLNGMISDSDIQKVLSSSNQVNIICEDLITLANRAGGLDNITVSVVSIQKSPYSQTVHDGLSVGSTTGKLENGKIYNKLYFQLSVVAAFLFCFYFLIREMGAVVFQSDVPQEKVSINDSSEITGTSKDTSNKKTAPHIKKNAKESSNGDKTKGAGSKNNVKKASAVNGKSTLDNKSTNIKGNGNTLKTSNQKKAVQKNDSTSSPKKDTTKNK